MAISCAHLTSRVSQTRVLAAGVAATVTLVLGVANPSVSQAASSSTTTSPAYGWPIKPFHRQHPVSGFFGDPRIGMTPKGMHSGFHFGIDISCPNRTPVYATMDGTVRVESFRPEVVTIVGR